MVGNKFLKKKVVVSIKFVLESYLKWYGWVVDLLL